MTSGSTTFESGITSYAKNHIQPQSGGRKSAWIFTLAVHLDLYQLYINDEQFARKIHSFHSHQIYVTGLFTQLYLYIHESLILQSKLAGKYVLVSWIRHRIFPSSTEHTIDQSGRTRPLSFPMEKLGSKDCLAPELIAFPPLGDAGAIDCLLSLGLSLQPHLDRLAGTY